MYELEFIPICTLKESTWIQHESKELTQDLLDFIENEFEDDISDFEMVIVYEEECYNLLTDSTGRIIKNITEAAAGAQTYYIVHYRDGSCKTYTRATGVITRWLAKQN